MKSELNEKQKAAANTIDGNLVIIAGPGAGKTHTLCRRTINMINNGIKPEEILLFTFTKKAAEEIKERIENLDKKGKRVNTGTYHSIAYKILRENKEKLGYSGDASLSIITNQDKIIREVLQQYKVIPADRNGVRFVKSYISMMKANNIHYKESDRKNISDKYKPFAKVYREYQRRLMEMNMIDFDDIILNCVRIMTLFPEIKREINSKYKYIIADEAHDSSKLDLEFVRLLGGENISSNICLILDDDQSIYGFRGANIDNTLEFIKRLYKVKIIRLDINYRSTKNIVLASRTMIKNNKKQLDKNIESYSKEESNKPMCLQFSNMSDECDSIAKIIKKMVKTGRYKYNDIAILSRNSGTFFKYMEKAAIRYEIPYMLKSGKSTLDKSIVKVMMDFMEITCNPYNRISFENCLLQYKGLGQKTIDKILLYDQSCTNMLTLSKKMLTDSDCKISSKVRKYLESIICLIDDLRYNIEDAEKCYDIVKELIYSDVISKQYATSSDSEEEEENRIKTLQDLEDFKMLYVEDKEDLFDVVECRIDEKKFEENDDAVSIQTFHSSKGLEWKTVFLGATNDGIMPSWMSLKENEEKGLEEERRLMYVAMTRAKKILVITCSKVDNITRTFYKRSRFIEEIKDVIDIK